jgi:sugar phosphate isomerase/epimerase
MSLFMTGFADEAAADIAGQIAALKELGWTRLEARAVDGRNIHDLDDDAFERTARALEDAGIGVCGFGSTIANFARSMDEPMDADLEAARRAIPRMRRLGTKQVRIMSYAVRADRAVDDQREDERIDRLRILCDLFLAEGLQPLHENCMNYGGISWRHTMRLVEAVPGLKLVFDTANPGLILPHSPRQSSWEFYRHVRPHIAHVHVKDMVWDDRKNEPVYTFPGEGDRDIRRILADLFATGYDGGISIEPHMSVVFHDESVTAETEARFANFVEYGRRMARLVDEARREATS